MSLPEKKRIAHWKKPLNDECRSDCPACIQDETYKRLAGWIPEELMPNTEYKTINTIGNRMAVSDNGFLRIEDFEALNKLKEEVK